MQRSNERGENSGVSKGYAGTLCCDAPCTLSIKMMAVWNSILLIQLYILWHLGNRTSQNTVSHNVMRLYYLLCYIVIVIKYTEVSVMISYFTRILDNFSHKCGLEIHNWIRSRDYNVARYSCLTFIYYKIFTKVSFTIKKIYCKNFYA